MLIGKIVKSNSHIDYVCQIYGPGEVEQPPAPDDYALGTFVRIELETQPRTWLVGITYNPILMNPDFGNLGPRLSPKEDLEVFSPDYLSETATLSGIIAIGTQGEQEDGGASHTVPALAASVDAMVERMTDEQVKDFHRNSPSVRLGYVPLLLAQNAPVIPYLLLEVISELETLFPNEQARLAVLRNDIAWKSKIETMGGWS